MAHRLDTDRVHNVRLSRRGLISSKGSITALAPSCRIPGPLVLFRREGFQANGLAADLACRQGAGEKAAGLRYGGEIHHLVVTQARGMPAEEEVVPLLRRIVIDAALHGIV